MAGLISELLGANEPMFSAAVKELEQAAGFLSVDVRLSAEIKSRVLLKSRELGLDPRDSTGPELYQALLGLARLHDGHLVRALGGNDPADVSDIIPRMKLAVDRLSIPKKCWALKPSAAKRMLKQMPPRNVMKRLGYKSLESMLKRESVNLLYAALRFAESPAWYRRFLQSYKHLMPSDFEPRDVEVTIMPYDSWLKLTKNNPQPAPRSLMHLKELGLVMLLPMPVNRLGGLCLAAFPRLIHYINEVRVYSSYFKLCQVKANFGELVSETLLNDPHCALLHGGHPVHWRVLQRHFGRHGKSLPEMFEPHVQAEDLQWRQAEEVLYRLEPSLYFWFNLDWVGAASDGQVVSFNLMDVAVAHVNNLPYAKRSVYHLRDSLWNEMISRYLEVETMQANVVRQLDGGAVIV